MMSVAKNQIVTKKYLCEKLDSIHRINFNMRSDLLIAIGKNV